MRIFQVSLQGISEASRGRISVDFEALGPGLIAIVGDNGAGKSTLIGSVFAALFRQLPGQKRSLYDFCTHLNPESDMTFGVNGGRYRSLLKLDPKTRQMESYIFDHQGVALASGKKEAFAEWTSRHVGSAGGFLASISSSQRRTGNFLSLERSQRKELFVTQLLGLERLRLISATARGFADEKGKKVLVLEGEKKGISQVLVSGLEVDDIEALARELEALDSRLQGLESVPCGGQGPYAGCVKIQRAIRAQQQPPVMEGEYSTLELELELQRGSLVTILVSSAQLIRQLQAGVDPLGRLDLSSFPYFRTLSRIVAILDSSTSPAEL